MRRPMHRPPRARGIVMISSLLLLLVLTLIAISMFRSFGLDEKIAGNIREKNRALQAAMSAQQYAEWWLTQGNNINTLAACAPPLLVANTGGGTVCTNNLSTITPVVGNVPWLVGGAPVGTSYTPDFFNVSVNAAQNTYYAPPVFYISQLGPYPGGNGAVYQIDAYGYGATIDSVAVVESTFLVSNAIKNLENQ
jgi:type IV pilus assembly protein PilX